MTWCFASTLILYQTYKQRQTAHTGTSRLTHPYKYISTPHVMWSQQFICTTLSE